jgi:predicted permease
VGSLAVGLGLTAALASVADTLLFRPLPVADPEQVFRIFTASPAQPLGFSSYPDFDDLRRASHASVLIAQTQVLVAVASSHGGAAQVRMGLAVTPDYFRVLDVNPAIGRTFEPTDERDAVVVLANDFWRAQFGADPAIVGRRVELGAAPFTVIGVAPANFGLSRFTHEDFYVPIEVYDAGLLPSTGKPTAERGRRFLSLYGRLHSGATLAQARAEIEAAGEQLAAARPDTNRGRRMLAMTEFDSRMTTDKTMPVLAGILAAVATLILVIAGVNAAGLLLVRADARAGEIAVQIALGASRGRLLAENLLAAASVAIAGAVLSWPVFFAAIHELKRSSALPSDISFQISPRAGWHTFQVVLVAAVIVTAVCGLIPSFPFGERNVARMLKARTVSRGRVREILVMVEIALAAALVACGFSLLNALWRAARLDPGFRTDHILTMALDPAQVRYSEAQSRALYDQVSARVVRIPGVQKLALGQSAPLGFSGAQRQIEIAGEPEKSAIWINIVSPEYFDLFRIPILRGRAFGLRDTAGSPAVAIVNEELARRCPVGMQFRMNGRMVEVVGIARNAKYFSTGEAPQPYFYLPFSQNYASRMFLLVGTAADPAASAPSILNEIHSIDAVQPVSEVRAARDYLTGGSTLQTRIAFMAMRTVGICGLLLALAGLYGVVAQSIAARRKEMAIRLAVGATKFTIVRIVLFVALRTALAGNCAGIALALVCGRWVARPGFESIAATAACVLGLSTLAALIPAMKAAAANPAACLRE